MEHVDPEGIWEPIAGVVDAEVSAALSADGSVVFCVLVGSPSHGQQSRACIELILSRDFADAVAAMPRESRETGRTITVPPTPGRVGIQLAGR
jgi:hypothetical protein